MQIIKQIGILHLESQKLINIMLQNLNISQKPMTVQVQLGHDIVCTLWDKGKIESYIYIL